MLDQNQKQRLKTLVYNYRDIFAAVEGEVGATTLTEFKVWLKEDATPHKAKVHPLNPKQRESLRTQLDHWIQHDIIEEAKSPWVLALVPVMKKDQSIRWAVDYRKLNTMMVSDAYPLPIMAENLDIQ